MEYFALPGRRAVEVLYQKGLYDLVLWGLPIGLGNLATN